MSEPVQLYVPEGARRPVEDTDPARPRVSLPDETRYERGSPQWWLAYLEQVLAQQQYDVAKADRYYRGQHDTMFISRKYRDAFGSLLSVLVENWMPLVVDALRERIVVTGFHIPNDPTDSAEGETESIGTGDARAWSIWQANDLDAESQLGHTEAFIKGRAFVMVNPFMQGRTFPEITIEDPQQMVVVYAPGSPRRVAAALKVFQDLYGQVLATLYLPGQIYKFTRARGTGTSLQLPAGVQVEDWVQRETTSEPWPLPNPLGEVTIAPLENRPRLLSCGESELAQVMSTQDAINKILADLMVASEFAAFPQRTLIGYEPEVDPRTGKRVLPFDSGSDRVWTIKKGTKEGVAFGEFQAADLANYTNAKKVLIEALAARTRVPAYYFGLVGQWPSGEALKAAEAGLVSKASEKQLFFGNAWEKAIRYAFRAMKDPRGDVTDSETLWKNPEIRQVTTEADAAVKKRGVGVPWHQLMVDLGYSPQEIARMEKERAAMPVPEVPAPEAA